MSHFNSVVCGPKFTQFFWPNVEGVVVDNGFFRLSIWRSVPKTFAIKVESCQKLRRILDVYSPSQILGGGPSKNCTRVITPDLRHVDWKKFYEDTPTRPEVIVADTLNFRPNFKFSRLKFFNGDPLSVPVCAGKPWSICSACENFRAQHPLRVEI